MKRLSIAELELMLMEETKRLTAAIRNGELPEEREQLDLRIQEIQKLLEEKNRNEKQSSA